jgi:magnesium transporter
MDPRVTRVSAGTTVRDALARLRSVRGRTVHDLFLVDDEGRLTGTIAVLDLAVAPTSAAVGSLTRRQPVSLSPLDTRDDIVERLAGQAVASLPVVDVHERLVGVIRPEKLVSVAQEEAGSDMQAMVGASREEHALSPISFAVRKRLPWLQINLATAFLAASVVGLFESTIARFTALAVLLPVVAGQSGNTGAQALAVTMRGLALREVRVRHWSRIAFKETGVAFFNGCAVAATTAAGVYVWSRSPGLAFVIALSMVISMLAAGLAGAVIPVLLTASGQDPAQSSSILLTTVTDVVGFFSFLGIAALLSGVL